MVVALGSAHWQNFLQVELAWSLHIVVCTWFVVLPDVLGQTIDRQESTCLLAWRLVSSVVHHRILVVDVVVWWWIMLY